MSMASPMLAESAMRRRKVMNSPCCFASTEDQALGASKDHVERAVGSVFTVANRLGHNNANTVLKTYGHLVANHDDRTRQAIDRLWATRTAKDVEVSGHVVDLQAPQ
jgi:predicted alpha/beta hydrolase family esterase